MTDEAILFPKSKGSGCRGAIQCSCTGSAKVRLFFAINARLQQTIQIIFKKVLFSYEGKKKFIFYHRLQQDTRKNHVSCSKCMIVNVNIYRFLLFLCLLCECWNDEVLHTYVAFFFFFFLLSGHILLSFLIQNMYSSPFKKNCSELLLLGKNLWGDFFFFLRKCLLFCSIL